MRHSANWKIAQNNTTPLNRSRLRKRLSYRQPVGWVRKQPAGREGLKPTSPWHRSPKA